MTIPATPGNASVPAPYSPVKASAREFRCLGRTTTLGPMLLPTQITAAGESLLRSPVRIITEPSSAMDGITGNAKLISNNGDSAAWEWHGESSAFKIDARMTGDCDGLAWYEITATPKKPVELSSLRLEIPRCADTATYIHSANFRWGEQLSSGLKEHGGTWKSGFMPYLWLGDEDRGLAWCCESDQGSRLNEGTNALRVETKGDTVILATALLDHAETIDSPITLKFALQGHHDEWSIVPFIPWIPDYKPEYRTFDATCARSGWQDWLVAGIDKLCTDFLRFVQDMPRDRSLGDLARTLPPKDKKVLAEPKRELVRAVAVLREGEWLILRPSLRDPATGEDREEDVYRMKLAEKLDAEMRAAEREVDAVCIRLYGLEPDHLALMGM